MPTRFLVPATILLLACDRATPPETSGSPSGEFSASWIGSDTGKLLSRPRGLWCEADRYLQVTAVKGDAGVALAIYPAGELRPGVYDVFDPGVDSIRRPGVAGAARWFSENSLIGFQGDSGSLELSGEPTALKGAFELRLRSLSGEDTIRLTGRFSGVRPAACFAHSVTSGQGAE